MYFCPSQAPLQGTVNSTVWDHTHVFYMLISMDKDLPHDHSTIGRIPAELSISGGQIRFSTVPIISPSWKLASIVRRLIPAMDSVCFYSSMASNL